MSNGVEGKSAMGEHASIHRRKLLAYFSSSPLFAPSAARALAGIAALGTTEAVAQSYDVLRAAPVMNGDLIALVDRSPPQLQGRYPLPSCDYLKLHAVCCHVAHLSGADSYLDELREEMQEVRTLAEDGSSTELLASALARVAVR